MTVVGIDLGTTNTVVAAARGGRAVTLRDEDGSALLPSVVSFHPNGDVIVGAEAKQRRTVDARNTVFSVKRLIGRNWDNEQVQQARERLPFAMKEGPGKSTLVQARGQAYTLAEISAFVLGRAKEIAEARLGETVDECVITVPANFNDLQRAATKVAGRVAGLEVLRILNEPTAAALAYGFGKGSREKLAVYDLGGGTFDITLLDLNDHVFEVLATAGDTFLGGDDIDRVLAERMAEQLLSDHRVSADEDIQVFERLRAAAENLKIELSTNAEARVVLSEIAHRAFGKPLDFEFRITRTELEALARPFVDRSIEVCREALDIAGLATSDIDQLLLVGGSTRLPLVQRTAAAFWGRSPHGRIHPDEVVALGAAIQGAALSPSKAVPTEIPAAPLPAASLPPARAKLPSWTALDGAPRPRLTSIPPQPELGALRVRQPSTPGLEPAASTNRRATEHSLLSRLEARPSSPSALPNKRPPAPTLLGMGTKNSTARSGPPPRTFGNHPPPPPWEPRSEAPPPTWPAQPQADIEALPDEDLFDQVDSEPAPTENANARPSEAAKRPRHGDTVSRHSPSPRDTILDFDELTWKDDLTGGSTREPRPALPPAPSTRPSEALLTKGDDAWRRSGALLPQAPTWQSPQPESPQLPPLLIDVTPLSLGVEVVGGYCDTIIERNSPVPCERSRQFITARDDQTTVRVCVSQGQSQRFRENTLLGDLVLSGLRPAPRGSVTIDVTFALDESGLLSVSARDTKTGAQTQATLRLLAIGEQVTDFP